MTARPRAPKPPAEVHPQDGAATALADGRQRDLQALQLRLGLRFTQPALLARALVHRSRLNEAGLAATDSNERLEFLGDAVLGYVSARELYRRYPEASEGQLTVLRAALVSGEALARVAVRIDLGDFLVLGRGEEQSGGRTRPMNLAGAFEAVVGALCEDGGLRAAQRFILRIMAREFAQVQPVATAADPKSRLQEWCQAGGSTAPAYRVVAEEGPDHARVFRIEVILGDRVLGAGSGSNKRAAERAAAEHALAALADTTS